MDLAVAITDLLLIGAKLTSAYRRGTMKSLRNGALQMPLQRGEVQDYDFNRMIVEFTMVNQGKVILCAISTAAMDDLEGRRDVRPDQRVDQFMRLREVIEERASRKFFESRSRSTDPWCCDPTISFDNRYISGQHMLNASSSHFDPRRPSRQSAPRLIADANAALASPCRPQTISCRDGVHLLGGGLPGLMDSIRRCRTVG
jgi:Protein of unknown function (DUF1488)